MSRRKQAKPQHLKSDEELPPPDGAPEHGEGPRGGGESSWLRRASVRCAAPARAGRPRGPGPPPERAARGVAGEVNLAPLPRVGELRAKAPRLGGGWEPALPGGAGAGLGGGGRGPRLLFRAVPRAPCVRTWGWPQRPRRRPPGGRSGGEASEAHLPLDAHRAALFGAGRPERCALGAGPPPGPGPAPTPTTRGRLIHPEAVEPRGPRRADKPLIRFRSEEAVSPGLA